MARFSVLRLLLISALVFNISFFRPALAEEESTIAEEAKAAAEKAEEIVEDVKEAVSDMAEEAAEAVADAIPEEVIEEAEEVAETVKETVKDVKESVFGKSSGVVKEKIQELVDKVKSLDKVALKKIAAGAIGVWGVSVAVGWLTKGSSSSGNDFAATSAPQKKKR